MTCNKIVAKGRLLMKDKLITQITSNMAKSLTVKQLEDLKKVLTAAFTRVEVGAGGREGAGGWGGGS